MSMFTCPHCGYESAAGGACPLCGTATAQGEATVAADAAVIEAPIPEWEDAARGFPRNLFETWRRSMFQPTDFFRGVPYERPAARPLLYYLIITVFGAFFTLWWQAVFSTAQLGFLAESLGTADALGYGGSMAASAMLNFFIAPFAAVIGLVLWALVLHLFVLMLGRQRRDLKATVRAISYAAGPAILGIVPVLGSLAGGVWTLVLTVIGIREAHRMTTGGALAVVFLPVVLLFGFVFTLVILVVAAASMGM
ncbi:MAG: YIP1 family protein [Gemmatimonadetes bacterium]|nr:YIP1 family protein [Gemmatimonadota bacterium]